MNEGKRRFAEGSAKMKVRPRGKLGRYEREVLYVKREDPQFYAVINAFIFEFFQGVKKFVTRKIKA